MFADEMVGRFAGAFDCSPWGAAAGRHVAKEADRAWPVVQRNKTSMPLYTPEEKRRRDASPWTLVQGILAPLQFAVFAVSLFLVARFLLTGAGEQAATLSVVVKTGTLYTIMVTGAIWEHEIYGKYLFAPAFFWEDAVSMVVIALHTLYMWALISGATDTQHLMFIALAAYAAYVVNAMQFMMKLRAARLSAASQGFEQVHGMGAA